MVKFLVKGSVICEEDKTGQKQKCDLHFCTEKNTTKHSKLNVYT